MSGATVRCAYVAPPCARTLAYIYCLCALPHVATCVDRASCVPGLEPLQPRPTCRASCSCTQCKANRASNDCTQTDARCQFCNFCLDYNNVELNMTKVGSAMPGSPGCNNRVSAVRQFTHTLDESIRTRIRIPLLQARSLHARLLFKLLGLHSIDDHTVSVECPCPVPVGACTLRHALPSTRRVALERV